MALIENIPQSNVPVPGDQESTNPKGIVEDQNNTGSKNVVDPVKRFLKYINVIEDFPGRLAHTAEKMTQAESRILAEITKMTDTLDDFWTGIFAPKDFRNTEFGEDLLKKYDDKRNQLKLIYTNDPNTRDILLEMLKIDLSKAFQQKYGLELDFDETGKARLVKKKNS